MNKKILLVLGGVGVALATTYLIQNRLSQQEQVEMAKTSNIQAPVNKTVTEPESKIHKKTSSHQRALKKSTVKKIEAVKTVFTNDEMSLKNDANIDYKDEEYIKDRIAKALEAHRKFKGKEDKETPEQKAERERIWQENAKIIDNLQGVESTFFALDRAINTSIIEGIREDETFYDVLDQYQQSALDDPIVTRTTQLYSDTFLGTLESSENDTIVMTDFQCGQASCLGSFHSYNNADWHDFIKKRNELFGERFPYKTFINFPQIIDENTAIHRIFFAYNGNIDAMYSPGNETPPDS